MLSPRGKKELKINQRRILINSIEIGIPAPEQVFILGQRHTSNGKVVGRVRNSKTLNYKSFTPHRDGLFCERIFGPVQSYICACGKQGPLTTSKGTLKFCPRCEVEYTDQRARRYRVGYIGLVSPVTHIWHLKGRPSYLSLFLGKRKKTLATLAYCNDYLVEQAFSKVDHNGVLSSAKQHRAIGADFFKNRILKGLTESKVIKGLALSREQEKSKVWSPAANFIDETLSNKVEPEAGTTFRSAPKGPNGLCANAPGPRARTTQTLLRKVAKFDEQNRARTSFLKSLRLPKGSTTPLPPSAVQVKCEAPQKRTTLSYTRSQTLPFLPTFICEFHLRDGLLSFFDTFPPSEDIPIPVYCQIPRRYPLRDVHKFMADQAFSKVHVEQSSTKGFNSQNTFRTDQRSTTNCADRRPGQVSKNRQIFRYKIFDFARTSFDKLVAGQKLDYSASLSKPLANQTGPLLLNRRSYRAPLEHSPFGRVRNRSNQLISPNRPEETGPRCSPTASSAFDLLTSQGPKSLQVGQPTPASRSFNKIKTNNSLPRANFSSKMRVIGGSGQLCSPKREFGLINGKNVSHISIGTVNEKRLSLREAFLRLFLGKIVTTLIGLTPSLTTYLNRPETTISKPTGLPSAALILGPVGAQNTGRRRTQRKHFWSSQRTARAAGCQTFSPLLDFGMQSNDLPTEHLTFASRNQARTRAKLLLAEGQQLPERSSDDLSKAIRDPSVFRRNIFGQLERSRPPARSSYPKVLIGGEPTVVMTRRVGSQVTVPAADETGTFVASSGQTGSTFRQSDLRSTSQNLAKGEAKNPRFVRVLAGAPNKTEGFVLASHVWTPELRYGWPQRGLKEISNYEKVKRLNDLLRVKRFALAKPIWLRWRMLGFADQAPRPNGLLSGSPARFLLSEGDRADGRCSGPLRGPEEALGPAASAVLLKRPGRVSSQNKSSYSKRRIMSEDLRFKHAKEFSLPVIGESPARLTIRLVFADGWSDLGSLSQARLANPYRSSSGYRLAIGVATDGQSPEASDRRDRVHEDHSSRLDYISNKAHFEDSFFSLGLGACSAKPSMRPCWAPSGPSKSSAWPEQIKVLSLSTAPILGPEGAQNTGRRRGQRNPLVSIATKVAAEPPLRSWVGLRSNLSIASACSASLSTRFGENVEDWLENWFDRWLQDCYAVKSTTGLAFIQVQRSQSQNLLSKAEQQPMLFGKYPSGAELERRRPPARSSSSNQIGEKFLFKQSKRVQPSVGQPFCSLKGPLLLLALRSYALGLTDRPGRNVVSASRDATSYNTPFFNHSQIASIQIQLLWSTQYDNFSYAKVNPILGLEEARQEVRSASPLLDFATQSKDVALAQHLTLTTSKQARTRAKLLLAEGQQLPERSSDQNNIILGRFTTKLGASAPRSNARRTQASRRRGLLRKITKLNETKIRSVGPKHNISSYLSKHEQRVKWVKREALSSDPNQGRGINRLDSSAQPVGSETGLWPVRPSILLDVCSVDRRRGSCSCSASLSKKLSKSKRRRPVFFANSVFLSFSDAKSGGEENPTRIGFATQSLAPSGLRDTRIDWLGASTCSAERLLGEAEHALAPSKRSAERKTGTSITGTTFQLAPKGGKSVINLDSQVWFPEIVTIFKSSEKPRWRTTEPPDAWTTQPLPPKGGNRAELLMGPEGAQHGVNFSSAKVLVAPRPKNKNPNNKSLFFTDDRNAINSIPDATNFSESDAATSKSFEEDISVGGTFSELRDGNSSRPPARFARVRPRRGLKNQVERMLTPFGAKQAPLTTPRSVLSGSTWAHRALEKYRGAGLHTLLTQPRQLNKSASALRSALVQAPRTGTEFRVELANQAQDGQTKPDVFLGNEDEYGDEEGPVSAVDDEPEINRVGGQLLASRSQVFRTNSDSAQLSKAQPRRVGHNATAPEAGKGGTDSYIKAQLDLQAIQEVLSYTGGGALRELLRCFDTQAFSVILLNEIKLLREYHKGYFLYEYDQVSRKALAHDRLGVTGGRSEVLLTPVGGNRAGGRHWPEGPKTPLERPLLNEPDQVDNTEGFVRRHKLNKSANALLLNRSGFVKPSRSSKSKQSEMDNKAEYDNNYEELPDEINRFSRAIHRNARRLKIVHLLMRNKRRPEWMLISALPVLPPDLRPILQMSENLIVASDLNTLYQRVIYRNNRQYKLRIVEWSYATSLQRLVQDAVDRLIENGKGGSKPFLTPGGRPLKSLSDTLKGKKGRFRLNLLGKRVDFSGRSVIVVSPHLKIHECGLPREMALELYQYLLIRQMLLKRQVSSVILAKRVIRQQKAFVWDTLRELIYHHPILLNRAPTLHRLGIQAFQPKLVLGSTILLHPLVCAGFNADFDGDQMGVHLPLCDEARAESWDLLWSRNNLLSPATGEPILLPSQDMVLGFYHMTALLPSRYANSTAQAAGSARSIARSADKIGRRRGSGFVQLDARPTQARTPLLFEKGLRKSHFFSPLDVVRAFQNGDLDIHTPIWLQWNGKIENNDSDQTPLEVRLTSFGVSTQLYPSYKSRKDASSKATATFNLFIRTTPGRVIVNNIFLAPTGQTDRAGGRLGSALSTDRYNTAN